MSRTGPKPLPDRLVLQGSCSFSTTGSAGRTCYRVRAKGGVDTGASPVDRGKTGSQHHLNCDGDGIPLAVTHTGGNRNDITQPIPLLDAIRRRRGRPHRRPDIHHGFLTLATSDHLLAPASNINALGALNDPANAHPTDDVRCKSLLRRRPRSR